MIHETHYSFLSLALVAAVGVSACGGGGGGGGAQTPTPEAPTYAATDERPDPVAAPVGTSVSALSDAVGVGGAARMSGNIPSPDAASALRGAARSVLVSKEMRASRKIELSHRGSSRASARVADTAENRAALEGFWVPENTEDESPVAIVDGVIYEVNVDSGCWVGEGEAIEGYLPYISAVSDTSFLTPSGVYSVDPSGAIEACFSSMAANVSRGFVTLTQQVSFSDNSTFAFSFSSESRPTAFFVQLVGAQQYFVIPYENLLVNGNIYSINLFGPTPSAAVQQVINEVIQGRIIVQAFYGDVSGDDLLEAGFSGADDSDLWSSPTYVNVIAQPARSGPLQLTLTWNNTADIDLYMEEPDGTVIFYGSPFRLDRGSPVQSPGGGALDVDDTNGFGPENIYYESEPALSGAYSVHVEHYAGELPVQYTLTVTRNGSSQTYSGTLTSNKEETQPIEIPVP